MQAYRIYCGPSWKPEELNLTTRTLDKISGILAHIGNLSIMELETGRAWCRAGQPTPRSLNNWETLFQNGKKKDEIEGSCIG